MIVIRPCTEAALSHVVGHLSEADTLEVMTVSGEPPEKGIRWGHDVSADSFAVHPILNGSEDLPVAIFGIVPDTRYKDTGVIWMVATDMYLSTSRDILKTAPQWINGWLALYPSGLHNLVDSRNERHLRWLRKMGARFAEGPVIRGIPFFYFHISRGALSAPPLPS